MENNKELIEIISIIKNNLKRIASNSINECDKTDFKTFYIERGFEDDFHQCIVNNDYVLLMGRAGSGKSTLIKKVIHDSEIFCKNELQEIQFLNFETEHDLNDKEIFKKIIEKLYQRIVSKYLDNYSDKIGFAKKLIHESKQEITRYYTDDAISLLNKFDIETRGEFADIEKIKENIVKEDSVVSKDFDIFLKKIISNNNAQQYLGSLLYYLYDLKKVKFLFIFDNVDSLSHSQQTVIYNDFVNFAQNINHEEIFAKLIISIRDENLFFTGKAAGNIYIESYYISQLNKNDEFIKDEKLIFKALNKKISILLKKRYIVIDNKVVQSDYKSVVAIKAILEHFTKDKFIIGNIFKYSNLSIRHAMYNVLDFISWLLKDGMYTYYTLIKVPFIMLNSLYIGWISSEKMLLQNIMGLNLVEVMRQMEKSNYKTVGCDISILILNFISNKNKNTPSPSVTFGDIAEELKQLSDENNLKTTIYNLYMLNKEIRVVEKYGHIISLPSSKLINSPYDITDNIVISLFPRAEELLFLSQTFTFNNILYFKMISNDENYISDYFLNGSYFSKLPKYLKNQEIFLQRLIKVHLIELYRIYIKEKKYSKGHNNWHGEYLVSFGHAEHFQIENIIRQGNMYLRNILRLSEISQDIKNELEKFIEIFSDLSDKYLEEIKNIKLNSDKEEYTIDLFDPEIDLKDLIFSNA